jgi:hypothetical protein
MAAQISHILAGEAAFEKATGGQGLSALGDASTFFALGCQGPDIFYHNQRTKPSGLHYGALAHRRRFGSLVAGAAASLSSEDRKPDSPAGAYLLGLATHAAVDRATHPIIVYFAGWVDPAVPGSERRRGCHPFFERLLDVELLRARLGIGPKAYGLSARLGLEPAKAGRAKQAEEDKALVSLWVAALRSAYPRATGADFLLEARVANALVDARHFLRETDPGAAGAAEEGWFGRLDPEKGRRLVSIVYPELPHFDLDAMNERKTGWSHPAGDGRNSNASYLELINEGSRTGAEAIELLLRFWEGELSADSLAAGIGEGGLAICDTDGHAVPPRLCRPLDLPGAMDAEYAARSAKAKAKSEPRPDVSPRKQR